MGCDMPYTLSDLRFRSSLAYDATISHLMLLAEGGGSVGLNGGGAPGAAGLHLVDGVSLLRPDAQVFGAMLFPVKSTCRTS
jgi:hypothetical protein